MLYLRSSRTMPANLLAVCQRASRLSVQNSAASRHFGVGMPVQAAAAAGRLHASAPLAARARTCPAPPQPHHPPRPRPACTTRAPCQANSGARAPPTRGPSPPPHPARGPLARAPTCCDREAMTRWRWQSLALNLTCAAAVLLGSACATSGCATQAAPEPASCAWAPWLCFTTTDSCSGALRGACVQVCR